MAISGVREVRQFGAKGDGTGDDTEAVKKAIASLPRYGGVLYFPPGSSRSPPPHVSVGSRFQGITSTCQPAPPFSHASASQRTRNKAPSGMIHLHGIAAAKPQRPMLTPRM